MRTAGAAGSTGEAMRIVLTVLMTLLLTLTAEAQGMRKKPRPDAVVQTEDQKKKRAAAEKAYKSSLEKTPDKKRVDPWAKVR